MKLELFLDKWCLCLFLREVNKLEKDLVITASKLIQHLEEYENIISSETADSLKELNNLIKEYKWKNISQD